MPELAVLYALGITSNHPFVDGNKRVAAVLMETFLEDNGFALPVDDLALYEVMIGISSGQMSDAEFTTWVVTNAAP